MTSLIEGFFQVVNPHQFGDNAINAGTPSPQKAKSYLTLYNSYVGIGPIAQREWLLCQLRLYSPDQGLDGRVVQVHRRFIVVPSSLEDDHCFEIEVHCFVFMNDMDPTSKNPPNTHFSVTVYSQVDRQLDSPTGTLDKFFTVEVIEFIRDHLQTYHLWFIVYSPTPPFYL
jgi:hypothetical protein